MRRMLRGIAARLICKAGCFVINTTLSRTRRGNKRCFTLDTGSLVSAAFMRCRSKVHMLILVHFCLLSIIYTVCNGRSVHIFATMGTKDVCTKEIAKLVIVSASILHSVRTIRRRLKANWSIMQVWLRRIC
eukprot:XP_001704594.1 Hypothetical protein GL50803_89099 [Giardia lamblia ATCC 50803]